jgi:hypothetical protein
MATYKLIQDIEAEDHILGPLTLRQFIFALIAAFCFYISFIVIAKHVEFLLILFLPPGLFFGFFAVPFGRDQPTEIWALAKIRFFIKPRKRLWDQSGVKELVTINVPKKIERNLTNGLNQYEVESRLNALANTLDSRGWAVKNANMGLANSAYAIGGTEGDSDRLIGVSQDDTAVPEDQVPAEADMLDETISPVAQHFTQMIDDNQTAHRQQLIDQMNSNTTAMPAPAVPNPIPTSIVSNSNNQWFMPHTDNTTPTITAPDVEPQQETVEEADLVERFKQQKRSQQSYTSNLRTLQPLGSQPKPKVPLKNLNPTGSQRPDPSLTDQPDPAIMNLANNNDFNVDTLAREAQRAKKVDLDDQDEVVIPLH